MKEHAIATNTFLPQFCSKHVIQLKKLILVLDGAGNKIFFLKIQESKATTLLASFPRIYLN